MDHSPATPLRFGLVGAGPWATNVHAPGIVAHPDTELVAVWARRPDAARALADAHGAAVADDVAALIADVDAVAFAVPPGVEADIAVRAAAAGRHLVLEKPIGGSVAEAERLADAVGSAGVASLVLLTFRYAPEVVEWVTTARTAGGWAAGAGTWFGDALLSGPYSHSPWRHERGGLVDVGPHTIDLLEAALGPITDVLAATHGDHDVWHALFAHESGARSTASLSLALPLEPNVVDITLYGQAGRLPLRRTSSTADCYATMLTELVSMINTGRAEHPLDVRRGLRLQRLIEQVERLALG
ncbi:MAG TPA: Gfo/Idh/MocA family oxidoreductase [Pseudonocardiaceae bacterium]|nr:Gfo/Idh/MocA family oxidoreductase [Pseudonocardiaceae bacterium]